MRTLSIEMTLVQLKAALCDSVCVRLLKALWS